MQEDEFHPGRLLAIETTVLITQGVINTSWTPWTFYSASAQEAPCLLQTHFGCPVFAFCLTSGPRGFPVAPGTSEGSEKALGSPEVCLVALVTGLEWPLEPHLYPLIHLCVIITPDT